MKHNAKSSNATVAVTGTEDKNVMVAAALKEALTSAPDEFKSKAKQVSLERAIKAQLGMLHKGRPVSTDSARQRRLVELEEKRAAGQLKPGRPAYTEEQKAAADARKKEREALQAQRIKEMAAQMLAAKS